ncbi:MAG: hypothetical protein JSU70_13750, partial [Phycisphaerales bacterium]
MANRKPASLGGLVLLRSSAKARPILSDAGLGGSERALPLYYIGFQAGPLDAIGEVCAMAIAQGCEFITCS